MTDSTTETTATQGGMIDYVRKGHFVKGQKIVFLHTGGVAGLFAYADILEL